jgi:hypothetical protein
MKPALLVLLSFFVILSAASVASAAPPLPEGPLVQACWDGVGVNAAPCPNWLCLNVGGSWGAPACVPLVPSDG